MLHENGATPPALVNVNEYGWPTVRSGSCGGLVNVGSGTAVPFADADRALSVTDVAVIVNAMFAATAVGAVYVVATPLAVFAAEIVPHAGEHAVPPCVSVQFTPALLVSFVTVAVKAFD
jgi:hypothetical protein